MRGAAMPSRRAKASSVTVRSKSDLSVPGSPASQQRRCDGEEVVMSSRAHAHAEGRHAAAGNPTSWPASRGSDMPLPCLPALATGCTEIKQFFGSSPGPGLAQIKK